MEIGTAEPVVNQESKPQAQPEDAPFRKQFEARHKGKTANGEFKYAHIVPENPQGDPLIFHPGWLADVKVCEPLAAEANNLGQELYIPDLIGHPPQK